MLKRFLVIGMAAILLVSIVGATSCKGYPEAPEDVVKEAYLCLSEMDYEGCISLCSEACYIPTEDEFIELLESEMEAIKSYDYYEVESVEIVGDTATVTGTIHFEEDSGYPPEPDAVILLKEDGKWKVCG